MEANILRFERDTENKKYFICPLHRATRIVSINEKKCHAFRGCLGVMSSSVSSASPLFADGLEGETGIGAGELGVGIRGEDLVAGDADLNLGDLRN